MLMRHVRILFAEDDSLLRGLAAARLKAFGCQVVEAPTGEEALSLLAADRDTHVLVTDIRMPGPVDGWSLGELCRVINPRLIVIYTSSGRPIEERKVPGSIFLAKPYHPDELLAAIRNATTQAHMNEHGAG